MVGTVSEVQPDRLRRLETWLWRETATDAPRTAVLIDFVPVASGQTRGAYRTGERVGATLVFYPSARPLRALIKESISPTQDCDTPMESPETDLAGAVAEYEAALCAVPWIGIWPLRFRDGRVRRSGERVFLCSADDDAIALPLMSNQATTASPLLAMDRIEGFGLWDGYSLRLCFAQTALGRWVSE